jgi:hypothetical protein
MDRLTAEASEGSAYVNQEMGLTMVTRPTTNGDKPLTRRGGPKGLLPSTWLNRSLRIEYVGAAGELRESTVTLLDLYPAGPVLNIGGAKTCVCWERLVLLELVED